MPESRVRHGHLAHGDVPTARPGEVGAQRPPLLPVSGGRRMKRDFCERAKLRRFATKVVAEAEIAALAAVRKGLRRTTRGAGNHGRTAKKCAGCFGWHIATASARCDWTKPRNR